MSYTLVDADLNSTRSRVSGGQNGVHEEHMALTDVPRQLLIDELLIHHMIAHLAGASALGGCVPICQCLHVNRLMPASPTQVELQRQQEWGEADSV